MRGSALRGGLLALAWSVPIVAQSPPPTTMPGLHLGIDALRAQYNHFGVGKRLKPKQWPNGARVAVALSFDVDNATVPLSRGQLGSEDLSRGMYGAIDGLPRILRMLDRQNVPASFFIPAVSARPESGDGALPFCPASAMRSACTAGFTSTSESEQRSRGAETAHRSLSTH